MLSSARIVYCAFTIASLLHSTFVQPTLATSSPRPPLARAAHPVVQSLDVFPRHGQAKHRRDTASATLLHTDSLRVTLTAYDQTYHLHLKPNEELVHPAARINYYRNGPNGRSELFKTAPLRRESVRAYHGEVVRADDKEQASRRFNEDVAGGLFRRYDTPAPANVRGWARIMIHSEGDPATGTPPTLEGAFSVDGDIHHVATYETYMRTKRPGDPLPPPPKDPADGGLVVFRNSDFEAVQANPAKSCTHDQLAWNSDPRVNPALRAPTTTPSSWYDSLLPSNLTRRQNDVGNGDISNNYISTIGQTDGCPKTQQIVYMGVAADCRYVATYENQDGATRRILENFNTATAQYKSTFNVSLGIVELNIHEAACPPTAPADAPWNVDCSTNIPLNERLSLFSQWRGQRSDNIGLWHLMSGCPTGTEVGVAWLSTLCMQTSSGEPGTIVSGTAVSTAGPTEWEVVTHEVGHNFGAIHDCTDGCTLTDLCCPSSATACLNPTEQFIMNPLSSTRERDFSPCSIGNICTGLQNSLNRTCLQDASAFNQNTISLQMCGNGIVEEGEECDPGQGASSECCDSTTCRFRAGAVCDPASSACCTQQCQFASSGTVCRPAMDGRCDVAETCTGTSAQCPADSTQPNGKQCGTEFGETLTCASGICTSVGQQCRLMGSSLNLTRECSQRSMTGCQVSCQDPRNAGRCLVLQATLPNGSPCGFGGTCQGNGECVSGTALNTVKAWYLQNLQISIPVTVVAGIILLLILWGIFGWLRRCCASRRSRRAASNAANQDYIAPPVVPASAVPRRMVPPAFGQRPDSQEGLLNGGPVSVPPQAHSRTRSPRGGSDLTRNPYALTPPRHGSADMNNSRPGWVDDTMYNGPRRR